MGRKTSDGGARKILVVDDDADWREFLKLCLEELGYEAVEAADGQQALDSLERVRCSVMLLDLNMPGMNGIEVLERLPKDGCPRVVFLTASEAQNVGCALRNGHYYLPKGANRDQLSLMLQSLEA